MGFVGLLASRRTADQFLTIKARVMNKKQLILKSLKTKAKAFGFNKKELESIADAVSDNLELAEDASDEDVNAAIETAVDAVLPFLQVSQSAASRAIQSYKDAHPVEGNDGNDGDDDPSPATKPVKPSPKKGSKVQTTTDDETPAWAQRLFDRLDKIEGEKTTDKRQSKLQKLLENTGSFGKRTMKAFARMKFENDEEFEEYLEEVQSDLDELNQERANDGLSKLGSVPPAKGAKTDKEKEVELMSDDELDKLAKEF